jgi:hypothetical protein
MIHREMTIVPRQFHFHETYFFSFFFLKNVINKSAYVAKLIKCKWTLMKLPPKLAFDTQRFTLLNKFRQYVGRQATEYRPLLYFYLLLAFLSSTMILTWDLRKEKKETQSKKNSQKK